MIRTVLIDDERPALRGLEHLLKEYPMIEIAGMFSDPHEAIEKISNIKPHTVFLDINMPQLQGIDAASRILDLCPDTDIVFVTAYDQYAVEAFELHALDYILKPVSQERFEKTLQRIIKKYSAAVPKELRQKIILQTFGKFHAGWEGKESIKWRTEKTKELFAFLLHNAGKEISKDEILEAVYTEGDIERSVHQLHNGIYYIRKTLQDYGVGREHISIVGNYMLKLGEAELDSALFREYIQKDKSQAEDITALQMAEALYTGDYFEDMDLHWAEAERERLARQFIEAMLLLAQNYVRKEEFNKAEELLLKLYDKEPYMEDITGLLIRLYKDTNRKTEAVRHYREYEKIIWEEFGIKPAEGIQPSLK